MQLILNNKLQEFTNQIFTNPNELPEEWELLSKADAFLSKKYLIAAFSSKPENMDWFYVIVYSNKKIVGIAVYQKLFLKGSEIFRDRFGNCLWDKIKFLLISPVKANLLILGNMLHTGEHAYLFNNQVISYSEFKTNLDLAKKQIIKICRKNKQKIHIELEKDYFNTNPQVEINGAFHKVSIQPNMILNLDEDWNVFNDYLAALTTKYRTRFKRARKKLKGVSVKELNLEALELNKDKIHELYKCVSDGAGFNTFLLPNSTFINLKKELKDQCNIFGLFLEDDLIGFYSLIHNNNTLEAYFLGYDSQYQRDKQLYLNMLYNMIEFGVENNFKQIVFARTAMEIKSSVGAEPHEMFLLIKHNNSIINRIVKPIFTSISSSAEWVQRKPFKQMPTSKEVELKSKSESILKV